MSMKFEFKNLPTEAPPPVDVPFNPKNSPKTALSNFCIANGKTLSMETTGKGEAHVPLWTAICCIDGMEHGKGIAYSKKSAENEAAKQALDALQKEDSHLSASRKYFPIFMDYVIQHKLDQRIEVKSESDGPDHKRTWRCTIYLDGIEIGNASGATKRVATEVASINAGKTWPWSC